MIRLVRVCETLWMVSPTESAERKRHSKPMKASTASGDRGTRQPRPEERQSGRRSGTESGSRSVASPVTPTKRATCARVSVTPGVSSGTFISTSSK